MSLIKRSITEQIRTNLSWNETWMAEDNGLIMCWEVGRTLRQESPELAEKATRGELPVLVWVGGIDTPLKSKKKNGSLQYLAQWQGLRGENLLIDTDQIVRITCTRTEVLVTFHTHHVSEATQENLSLSES
jgi:hypothetical protein